MAGFLSEALGNEGIAKMAGNVVGEKVEDTLKNIMGGDDKKEEKGGGFDAGSIMSMVGGKSDDNSGGVDPGKILSMVGGNKDGGGAAEGVKDIMGGFFKD